MCRIITPVTLVKTNTGMKKRQRKLGFFSLFFMLVLNSSLFICSVSNQPHLQLWACGKCCFNDSLNKIIGESLPATAQSHLSAAFWAHTSDLGVQRKKRFCPPPHLTTRTQGFDAAHVLILWLLLLSPAPGKVPAPLNEREVHTPPRCDCHILLTEFASRNRREPCFSFQPHPVRHFSIF